MLLHRLPKDGLPAYSWLSDDLTLGIDSIAPVATSGINRILAAVDVLVSSALALGLCQQIHQTSPLAVCAWVFATVAPLLLVTPRAKLPQRIPVSRGAAPLLLRAVSAASVAFSAVAACACAVASARGQAITPLLALAAAAIGCVALSRAAAWAYIEVELRRGRCFSRLLVLAGSLAQARVTAAQIERRSRGRLRVVGALPLPGVQGGVAYEAVEEAVAGCKIDQVAVREDTAESSPGRRAALRMAGAGVDVTLITAAGITHRLTHEQPDFAIPTGARPHAQSIRMTLKTMIDIAIASALTLITFPALMLIAALIRLESSGPVIFRQKRHGLNGTTFDIWKFRTMYAHMQDPTAKVQTSRNDRRVTRVGRFLRKASLDELPQLYNVLRGDMSIVGPRPHACGMTVAGLPLTTIVEFYNDRHRMKPGITGWAQINGSRGQVLAARALRRRVALDNYYIDNWSLRLDFMIILRTAGLMVFDPNAF